MDCLVNKKWLFCEKNHFLFSDQVKKMSLGQSGKNGPKTQFKLKLAFFYLIRKSKVIFFTKKSLSVFWPCQKIPYLAQIGFLAHFCHFGPVTFFWLGQKTKSDFFHKIITSYLLSNPFLWPEKLAAVITQTYFGRFCYCVPPWKISKHGFFESLGGPLWPCDSLLLWTGLFIQIHSETLWMLVSVQSHFDIINFSKHFAIIWEFLCCGCYIQKGRAF